jgi:hypothetical protein
MVSDPLTRRNPFVIASRSAGPLSRRNALPLAGRMPGSQGCVVPIGYRSSRRASPTIIRTMAGPVFTSAPSGSIHMSGVRTAALIM